MSEQSIQPLLDNIEFYSKKLLHSVVSDTRYNKKCRCIILVTLIVPYDTLPIFNNYIYIYIYFDITS